LFGAARRRIDINYSSQWKFPSLKRGMHGGHQGFGKWIVNIGEGC